MQVTLGGERLGSGNKNKISMRNYERSTHDLSYVWRSTMAAGTLVPFMTEVGLPGDTFDINLNCDILTHPTIGPLFGSYKIQLDVFMVPVRLYQAELHMNMLGIGRDMSKIKLPLLTVTVPQPDPTKPIDNQQINPSSLLAYLGIRGAGWKREEEIGDPILRDFNAIPYLGYWDIYKNYYANKQEEIGAFISKDIIAEAVALTGVSIINCLPAAVTISVGGFSATQVGLLAESKILIFGTGFTGDEDPSKFTLSTFLDNTSVIYRFQANEIFTNWEFDNSSGGVWIGTNVTNNGYQITNIGLVDYNNTQNPSIPESPKIKTFPLKNIDDMRTSILRHTPSGTPFRLGSTSPTPYKEILESVALGGVWKYASQWGQQSLALKTYNSDLFNNWISTEWIDGDDGVSAVTAIDTSGGSFTIDELNLSRKIYDMLNRIALSGGSYDDWLDAVYTEDRRKSVENPMYLGGLIQTLEFQEVISNAANDLQPLGTLAGRGKTHGRKGGHIIAKCDEPCYIMGIISLTPRIDYSTGNKYDTNLKTMNDYHKPALDEIGFQDLITDQMAWWDSEVIGAGDTMIFKSAGKQPAWINYMTNVNVVRGNFADEQQQMFMTLNRRYEANYDGDVWKIDDVTTYIDPMKFNQIFADTRIDAQNFWAQIGVNIEARRKMSAKVIPNL